MKPKIMRKTAEEYLNNRFLDMIEKRIILDRFMGIVSAYSVIKLITSEEYDYLLYAAIEVTFN